MEAGTQVPAVGRWSALRSFSGAGGWAPSLILIGLATAPGLDANAFGVLQRQLIEEVAA